MFVGTTNHICAGCKKIVSYVFPVKRKGSKNPSWLCTECYDKTNKEHLEAADD